MSSKQGGVLDANKSFQGTLLQLQDKVKRDPDGYKDDVFLQLRHFESKVKLFQLTPSGPNKDLCEVINFLSHVSPLYKEEARMFPNALLDILEKHKDVIERNLRYCMVQALCLLRSRQYVEPKDVLPLYFRLFKIQDRDLRELLLSHIVRDIKKMNAKKKDPHVNKQLQNYMYKVVQEDDAVAGRHALWVIIDLYRRQIWTDDRIVNVISQACFSKHTKVLSMSLRFMMGQFPKDQEDKDESEEEEEAPNKKQRNYAKKTKKRKTTSDKLKERVSKKRREKDQHFHSVFKPYEVLNDPQGFAEKLLTQLQKTKERFNVRMLHMGVISLLVHTHKLILLNYYPYIQRYMEPHQQHVTYIMAWASQAVHDLIPPESLHSLLMTIANHFVSDRASPDAITVGINTIREICRRQPLVMTEDLLQDIAQYKRFKKDKGVVMASRGMIQLFRELQPEMLSRKDRGRNADLEKKAKGFGHATQDGEIEGLELLENYYLDQQDRIKDREERDGKRREKMDEQWSADESSDDGSSSLEGSWVSVSESDGEGKEGEEGSFDAEEWEECSEDGEEGEEGEDDESMEEEGEEEDMVKEDLTAGEPVTREDLANAEARKLIKIGDGKLMETKFLTPRDFQILERLKQEQGSNGAKKSRKRKRDEEEDADEGKVTTDMLEAYSVRKRHRDAMERRATTEALRGSFKAKTKVQKKAGGTTNQQKKKGKLAQMVMRSRGVQSRKYETGGQKKKRMAVGKKRNIKFKYKKGGH